MHFEQAAYRELCDAILAYEGGALSRQVLAPWLEANGAELEWLRSFAARRGAPVPEVNTEELWRLYALSRVDRLGVDTAESR